MKGMNRFLAWVIILTPVVLWILPADFFDHGTVTLCVFKGVLGVECLGCGLTRGVMHFHHWEFEKGLLFNRGVALVYPVLILIWVKVIYTFFLDK